MRREQAPGGLSDRQLQIVALLVDGRTVKEIATELGLGLSTVYEHVANIGGRLGAKTQAEIAALAIRRGLV